jgi:hypothetical protein
MNPRRSRRRNSRNTRGNQASGGLHVCTGRQGRRHTGTCRRADTAATRACRQRIRFPRRLGARRCAAMCALGRSRTRSPSIHPGATPSCQAFPQLTIGPALRLRSAIRFSLSTQFRTWARTVDEPPDRAMNKGALNSAGVESILTAAVASSDRVSIGITGAWTAAWARCCWWSRRTSVTVCSYTSVPTKTWGRASPAR